MVDNLNWKLPAWRIEKIGFVKVIKTLYELKGALLYYLSRVVRSGSLHSLSAEKGCMAENVSLLCSVCGI